MYEAVSALCSGTYHRWFINKFPSHFAGSSCSADEACIKFLASFYLAVKVDVVSTDCRLPSSIRLFCFCVVTLSFKVCKSYSLLECGAM